MENQQESIQSQELITDAVTTPAGGSASDVTASDVIASDLSVSDPSPSDVTASGPNALAVAPPAPGKTPAPAITASGCSSCSDGGPSLVYALGQLDYDFGTEARRDSFLQHGIGNPHDPAAMLEYLSENPAHATALTWTLVQEATPIYAIVPAGPFASDVYATLREFLAGQIRDGVERVSIPGATGGSATLLNGQKVPLILPELRGMYSWSTGELVKAVAGDPPKDAAGKKEHAAKVADIANFLERIYYEIRNLGITPQDRAVNYAATNAFQIENVITAALSEGLKLDGIDVERSPVCRPESDCWDVKLTFFNPKKRLEEARKVYRFTIDVSDVVPVTVGSVRSWHVY